ncbi:MAG: Gfo/Idh/MocA family oxidoreductase, partial [Opitutales bacterium]|nr:Gfo/Idh/MocA family oxidoreductase [Opitutales bacterium]
DFRLSMSYGPGRYDPVYEEDGIDYPYGYVRWTEQRNMQAFVDLVSMGKITPSKLVTHRFDFENALDAYQLLLGKTGEPYMGIVLEYSNAENKQPVSRVEIKQPVKSEPSSPVISFVGCGNFTKAVLMPTLKKMSGYRLRGLCSASGMNCGETARKMGFEFATSKKDDIFADADTNLVFITTRHDTHSTLVEDALKVGKNVFVEKPLAITEEQLSSLEECVKNSSGKVMVGFNRRFSPHAKLIKEYFAKRAKPLVMMYRVNAGEIARDVWVQDPNVGGGRIIGEGCHFVDFMSYICGAKVVSVQATSIKTDNVAVVAEDSVNIVYTFADGSIGVLNYVALGDTNLPKEYCEVYGEGSTAIMDNFNTTICSGKLGKRKLSGKQSKGFAEEITALLDSVKTGREFPIELDSLLNTTRATFATLKALKSGSTELV